MLMFFSLAVRVLDSGTVRDVVEELLAIYTPEATAALVAPNTATAGSATSSDNSADQSGKAARW